MWNLNFDDYGPIFRLPKFLLNSFTQSAAYSMTDPVVPELFTSLDALDIIRVFRPKLLNFSLVSCYDASLKGM